MAQSPKNDSGMVPRSYQLEILEDIKKSNTILYLPTGCGKTYIATLLIRHMGECLTKPIGNGRKWTFFIVNSIPLVNQQASILRMHLPWDVGTFSAASSSRGQWDEILNKYQILVMTAQIYLNNLCHGFMYIKDANLLIFDECHHAVASHPFRKIMKVLHNSNLKSDDRPHILGLTATLINSKSKNVKDELSKLQITFDSTIKTKHDKHIQNFTALPKESICIYDEHILDNELLTVTSRISKIVYYLEIVQDKFKNETKLNTSRKYNSKLQKKETTNRLENYFREFEEHLNDGGVYIAYLYLLHCMLLIVKKQKICKDGKRYDIMCLALSELTIIRKILYDYMNKHSIIHKGQSTTLQHVSPKVKKLMEILSALKATDACLVFVTRRTTVKTLCHYIKDYIQEYNQKNIVCEFIVGKRGISATDCDENNYKKLQNNDIIKNFNSKMINVLITSQVLEEGIDIQTCNVVIRYDCPNNFNSYVQSKGRARSATSNFITMVSNLSILKYTGILDDFNEMEKDIKNILAVNNIEHIPHNDNDMSTTFKTMSGGALLNHANALDILNGYCMSLSEDQLSDFKEEYTMEENTFYKFKLTLPINSVIKAIKIDGISCAIKKDAKKSAAFNACIELYKIGALDEHLMLKNVENNIMQNYLKTWFPHWHKEKIKHSKCQLNLEAPKIKNGVHSKSPSYLHGSYPQVNKPTYLHVIHCVPDYIELKESNYEAFDKLFKSIREFGILTSNKLPQVSSFPIFSHFGTINVSIKVNVNEIFIDHELLKKLDNFHNKLFMDVLGVKNNFARSYDNEDNSYLVVPTILTDNIYYLDLNVIHLNKFVEADEKPTLEQRNSKFYEEYLSSIHVISPWYKNVSPVQRYIVTDVYLDKTPESSFESSEYDTYAKYFSDKYNIHVSHKNQPLIKVKSLDVSEMNYLTPRHLLHKLDKQTEHDNILIPEFCTWHKFPTDYWLKALMLPTILYRLEKLLLAEELFAKINSMCNIVVEGNTNEDSLKMDSTFIFNESKIKKNVMEINETLKYTLNNMDDVLEFDPNNFHKDIERIRKPTMSDLQNYQTFMYDQSEGNYNIEQTDEVLKTELNDMNPLNLTNNPPPILSPLIKGVSKQNIWPKQSDILKALTPINAEDIFNYECMETFGDSFLKFATSLVLYDACPLQDEGVLSTLRTKIVGNRHLCYVGRNSNIVPYMVNYFDPNTDWIPPCFDVPIMDTIVDNNISPDAHYQIIIPKNNKITDKMVADCVESLIGTYVYKCGVKVGYKVLRGLGIIPEQLIEFKPQPIENLRVDLNISNLLPGYKILEQRIGYSFKHKHLLVQALTHPTNEFELSECYQRLEFLGDAIIDFLITSYIMEHGTTKTSDEITVVRSSLVNNTTIGSLSARIGLHRFVLAKDIVIMTEKIDRFYKHFQKNNYQIGLEVLCLAEKDDFYVAEFIDVPKVLADVFESLIAAIYLDCNRDLNVVWTILYRFWEKDINKFCNNLPTNPLDILYKLNLRPIYSDLTDQALHKNFQIQLKIHSNQKSLTVYGIGKSKKEAKIAAAKIALKNMKKMS